MNQSDELFRLRSWKKGDENSLVENANNYKIWQNLRDIFPNPYTTTDAISWIKMAKKQSGNFAIEVNGQAVGGIAVLPKDDIYRKNMEIGYWLGEKYWGRGIMTKAIQQVVEYTFANFDIVRIYAGIFPYNIGSKRALEKAGFEHEATLKNAIIKESKTYDDHIWAIYKN